VSRIRIPSASSPVISRTPLPQSADFSKSVGTVSAVYATSPLGETRSRGAPGLNGTDGGLVRGTLLPAASISFASAAIFCLSAALRPSSR